MSRRARTVIRVADLPPVSPFSSGTVGFNLVALDSEAGVARIDAGGYPLSLAGPAAGDLAPHVDETHGSSRPGATLHFPAGDLAALQARLAGRGLSGVQIVEKPWGDTTLTVTDPDGDRAGFWAESDRTPKEVRALYARGPDALKEALAGLAEPDLDLTRAPGEWTIRQLVHHLVDSDATSLARSRMALAEPGRV